jgi:hypothetical protein
MNPQTSITVPASTADKLAALGRAMLDLACEMKRKAGMPEPLAVDIHNIPDDQRWFWTSEWQAKEKEADQVQADGKYTDFDTAEDAIAYLRRSV